MPDDISVPSSNRIVGSGMDFAYGLAGGVVYDILGRVASRFTGSALVGTAIAGIGAGAVVEGSRGEVIATIAGFRSAGLPEVANPVARLTDPIVNFGS